MPVILNTIFITALILIPIIFNYIVLISYCNQDSSTGSVSEVKRWKVKVISNQFVLRFWWFFFKDCWLIFEIRILFQFCLDLNCSMFVNHCLHERTKIAKYYLAFRVLLNVAFFWDNDAHNEHSLK